MEIELGQLDAFLFGYGILEHRPALGKYLNGHTDDVGDQRTRRA